MENHGLFAQLSHETATESSLVIQYGAIVLSPDGPVRWVRLGSAKKIDEDLREYHDLVTSPGQDAEIAATLQTLYKEAWQPAEEAFPAQTKRVIISPDGQLNFLSFATLLDPAKSFIGVKYSIQYVTSGRDLLREPKPTQNKEAVVVADPNFDTAIQLASDDKTQEGSSELRGVEKRDVEDLTFQGLPGTQMESTQLLREFGGWGWQTRSLVGADATKQALLDLQCSIRIAPRDPWIL